MFFGTSLQVKEKSHNKDLHDGESVMFDIIEKEKGSYKL